MSRAARFSASSSSRACQAECVDVTDEGNRGRIDVRDHRFGVLVETLAQARRRRRLGDAERRLEELILAAVLDRIEVVLAGGRVEERRSARM